MCELRRFAAEQPDLLLLLLMIIQRLLTTPSQCDVESFDLIKSSMLNVSGSDFISQTLVLLPSSLSVSVAETGALSLAGESLALWVRAGDDFLSVAATAAFERLALDATSAGP